MSVFNLVNDPNREITLAKAYNYVDRRNMSQRVIVDVDGMEMRFAGKIPIFNGLAVGRRNDQITHFRKTQNVKQRLRAKLAAKQN